MAFQPMPLSRRPAPFDHPEWVFELKYDGFRSLAIIDGARTQLISRNGHAFSSFTELHKAMKSPHPGQTVLDGEIVCLDKKGKPQFRDLLFHRGQPCFFAFDILMSEGKDLRLEKLTDRKHELRRILSRLSGQLNRHPHIRKVRECVGHPAACRHCAELIDADRWGELADRAFRRFVKRPGPVARHDEIHLKDSGSKSFIGSSANT